MTTPTPFHEVLTVPVPRIGALLPFLLLVLILVFRPRGLHGDARHMSAETTSLDRRSRLSARPALLRRHWPWLAAIVVALLIRGFSSTGRRAAIQASCSL